MKKIIEGIKKFQTEVHPRKRELFAQLSTGQKPSALVICCADSRVDMELVTQSEPGELFFFRNAGNIVPPYGAMQGALSATIEYAMVALGIRHVVVCGHSDCGAMKGIMQPELVRGMPTVAQWLSHADVARGMLQRWDDLPRTDALDLLCHENVLAQMDNLRTHPSVAVRLAHGEVELHGWFYDIPHGTVAAYDAEAGAFVPIDREPPPRALAGRSAIRPRSSGRAAE
jgi:carbonic anhydrase